MSTKTSYPLNKLLTSLAKQHATRERLTEEELAGHELTADERAALQSGDITRLYHLGANPYLIRRVFRPRFRV
jgi:aromatic-ring opening dioxygenase LigAB LigA subunit